MPIALERGGSGRSDGEGIIRRSGCGAGGDSPAGRSAVMALRIGLVMPATGMEKEEEANSCSSSIGRNSDCSGGSAGMDEEESGEAEVESAPQGPLDTTEALEEALPMRRGMSKFYAGKSRSFTSLAEVSSSSSTKDLAKPQNAYTRKRKNLLAFSINWDRHHNSAALASTRGSTPKRPASSSRSGGDTEVPAPPPLRPPPHPNAEPRLPPRGGSPPPRCHFSVRSLSLTDLQSAADPSIIPTGKHMGFD